MTMYCDRQAQLSRVTGVTEAGAQVEMTTEYSPSPKRFLLNGYKARFGKMLEDDHFVLETVQGYYLPIRMTKELQIGNLLEPGSAAVYNISNYKLIK